MNLLVNAKRRLAKRAGEAGLWTLQNAMYAAGFVFVTRGRALLHWELVSLGFVLGVQALSVMRWLFAVVEDYRDYRDAATAERRDR